MSTHQRPLTPKDGQNLRVGIVARISGCQSQKEISLDDQVDHGKEEAQSLFNGPTEYKVIATKGKGERLDRPELEELEKLLVEGTLDLLVVEDIGRLVRGGEANRLCGVAVDHGVRVISPNDAIDTWDDNWEQDVLAACADHVGYNQHTSKRIKHKLMTRFKRNGTCAKRPIAGYIVPPNAHTYGEWMLDSAVTPIIADVFNRLFDGQSYEVIADHLNQIRFAVGPYSRRMQWYGKMVARYMGKPLLCGRPQRGRMHSVKIHEKGRRISVKNPAGPTYFDAPHLAHISQAIFDRAQQIIADRRETYAAKLVNGKDPRAKVARKDSRFPGGGCARCWYCGRPLVWGGNGVTENLQCSGSRDWRCWNSVGVPGALATAAITNAISTELHALDRFSEYFADCVTAAQSGAESGAAAKLRELDRRKEELEWQKMNVQKALREMGPDPAILETLAAVNRDTAQLMTQCQQLHQLTTEGERVPQKVEDLRGLFDTLFASLATSSAEFSHTLRKIVTRFDVFLVRSIDGGRPLSRARVTLSLDSVCPSLREVDGLHEILIREMTLDLFTPAQRHRIRPMVAKLMEQGLGYEAIAVQIEEKPTSTAVQNAAALHRLMVANGLSDPYLLLAAPPNDYTKLRRHRNARYKFEPAEGYQQFPL